MRTDSATTERKPPGRAIRRTVVVRWTRRTIKSRISHGIKQRSRRILVELRIRHQPASEIIYGGVPRLLLDFPRKGDNSFAFVATKTTFLMGHPIPRQFRSQHPKPQWRYGERLAADRSEDGQGHMA